MDTYTSISCELSALSEERDDWGDRTIVAYDPAHEDAVYRLKMHCKSLFNRIADGIVWLADDQVAHMATHLYTHVHETENLFRSLINRTMLRIFGPQWWDRLVPNSIKDIALSRTGGYRRVVKDFRDVHDGLFNSDIDHLGEVLTIKHLQLLPSADLVQAMNQPGDRTHLIQVLEKLRKQVESNTGDMTTVTIDLWEKYFRQFFRAPDFLSKWKEFCKARHHVMHNKMVDKGYYSQVIAQAEELQDQLSEAINQLSTFFPTQEQIEEADALSEILEETLERQYKRDLRERRNEQGIILLSESGIAGLFFSKFESEVLNQLEDILLLKDVQAHRPWEFDSTDEGDALRLESENRSLVIKYKIDADEDPSAESTLTLLILIDGKEHGRYEVSLLNGDYEMSQDGFEVPASDPQMDYFPTEDILTTIEVFAGELPAIDNEEVEYDEDDEADRL